MKHKLLSVCTALLVFSCAPSPVPAQEFKNSVFKPHKTCLQFTAIVEPIVQAHKDKVPRETLEKAIDVGRTDRTGVILYKLTMKTIDDVYTKEVTVDWLKGNMMNECILAFRRTV